MYCILRIVLIVSNSLYSMNCILCIVYKDFHCTTFTDILRTFEWQNFAIVWPRVKVKHKYFDKEILRDAMDTLYGAGIAGKLYRLWFMLNQDYQIRVKNQLWNNRHGRDRRKCHTGVNRGRPDQCAQSKQNNDSVFWWEWRWGQLRAEKAFSTTIPRWLCPVQYQRGTGTEGQYFHE